MEKRGVSETYELLMWTLGCRKRYRVFGDSMSPAFPAGRYVLAKSRFHPESIKRGDVVICTHPNYRDIKLIKRVRKNLSGNAFVVQGDNPDSSTDSRDFGAIPARHVIALVTLAMD